jgi:hypothetical protein
VNAAAPEPIADEAEARVLRMQIKLRRWAGENEGRRFGDLFNLVATRPSCSWHGGGSGATGAHVLPAWTA